ncbi:MAG TPA: A/G-specific adenine glycosylase [Fimbriimonas sp.]|nr:A/G-specific adenine glycosylase [Fimbriimonas sp.]
MARTILGRNHAFPNATGLRTSWSLNIIGLLEWFDANCRDLPWRQNNDPYPVWISEIMLQQTQVATVIPYFERWMAAFPTVHALAKASESEVLKLWEGLGYYKRARMIHAAARKISDTQIPTSFEGWLAVPGVGEYTAAAISSIAFGEVQAVVDGNVKRVFARIAASDLTGPALHKAAHSWASKKIDHTRPGDWNQAVMELGATICTPANPSCDICPVLKECRAFEQGAQNLYPAKVLKSPPTQLRESIVIQRCKGKVGITSSHQRGWWKGLVMFPQFDPPSDAIEVGTIKYTVTNHRLIARVFVLDREDQDSDHLWIDQSQLDQVALPAPHRKALQLLTKLER